MQAIARTEKLEAPPPVGARLLRDALGPAAIVAVGLAGYWLLPDNLALLTRVIAVALLVLSLDLIVG